MSACCSGDGGGAACAAICSAATWAAIDGGRTGMYTPDGGLGAARVVCA
jgi:hypothetical protein